MPPTETVWMQPPGGGQPEEVDAAPDNLVPLMVAGWSQCEPPQAAEPSSKSKKES